MNNNIIELTKIIQSNIKLLNYYKNILNKIDILENNIIDHIKEKNNSISNTSNIINSSFNYHYLIISSK